MTDIAELGIRIEATDIKNAVSELNRLENQSGKTEGKIKKLRNSVSGLGSALSALGFAVITRQLIQQINTYSALENRLKLVTKNTAELNKVNDDLFKTAQETRGSFEGSIDLYSRLARSTQDLNISNERLVAITKTVNQTVALSGSTAATAKASLFQFGQGLGAGALRGEELNSVLEGTPELARAMADGLGVSIAELRTLGAQGELTANRVIKALERQASAVDKEFKSTSKTAQQAFVQLENVALKTFGSLDSKELVKGMDDLRKILTDPDIVSGLKSIASVMLTIVNLGVRAASGWGMLFKLFKDAAFDDLNDQLADTEAKIVRISEQIDKRRERGAAYNDLLVQLQKLSVELDTLRKKKKETDEALTGKPEDTAGTTGVTGEAVSIIPFAGQKDLDKLRDAHKTELQLLQDKFTAEQLLIDEALLNEALTAEEHEQLMTDIARRHSDERIQLEENEMLRRQEFAQQLSDAKQKFEQLAYDQGVGLLRRFAKDNKAIATLLIGIQTAKAVKDISIQSTAASAQVLAYGKVEAAAILAASAGTATGAAAAAVARSVAAAGEIQASAKIATGLAIASGAVDVASTLGDDNRSGPQAPQGSPGSPIETTREERVVTVNLKQAGVHTEAARELVTVLAETSRDMGGNVKLQTSDG